jgi:hypothetical protein
MKGFNDIFEAYKTNIVDFNLKYIIDRIKKLEETRVQSRSQRSRPSQNELKLKENLRNLLLANTSSNTTSYYTKYQEQTTATMPDLIQLRENFQLPESVTSTQIETWSKFVTATTSSSSSSSFMSNFDSLPLTLLMKKHFPSTSTLTSSPRHSYNLRSSLNDETVKKTVNQNQNHTRNESYLNKRSKTSSMISSSSNYNTMNQSMTYINVSSM